MDSFSKDPMLNSSPEESSLNESCKNPNSKSPKSSSNSNDECGPSVDALLKDILTDAIEDIESNQPKDAQITITTFEHVFESTIEDIEASQPKDDITSTTIDEVFESAVEDQLLSKRPYYSFIHNR